MLISSPRFLLPLSFFIWKNYMQPSGNYLIYPFWSYKSVCACWKIGDNSQGIQYEQNFVTYILWLIHLKNCWVLHQLLCVEICLDLTDTPGIYMFTAWIEVTKANNLGIPKIIVWGPPYTTLLLFHSSIRNKNIKYKVHKGPFAMYCLLSTFSRSNCDWSAWLPWPWTTPVALVGYIWV